MSPRASRRRSLRLLILFGVTAYACLALWLLALSYTAVELEPPQVFEAVDVQPIPAHVHDCAGLFD